METYWVLDSGIATKVADMSQVGVWFSGCCFSIAHANIPSLASSRTS
jgi:hypothetical protein